MTMRYDAPEVTKLRGMLETLRKENAALTKERDELKHVTEVCCKNWRKDNDGLREKLADLVYALRGCQLDESSELYQALAAAQEK